MGNDRLRDKIPRLGDMMDNKYDEAPAYMDFPRAPWLRPVQAPMPAATHPSLRC